MLKLKMLKGVFIIAVSIYQLIDILICTPVYIAPSQGALVGGKHQPAERVGYPRLLEGVFVLYFS